MWGLVGVIGEVLHLYLLEPLTAYGVVSGAFVLFFASAYLAFALSRTEVMIAMRAFARVTLAAWRATLYLWQWGCALLARIRAPQAQEEGAVVAVEEPQEVKEENHCGATCQNSRSQTA